MWTTEKGNLGLFSDGLGKIIPSWVNSAAALSASGHCHCAATSDMSVPQRKDELVAHLGMRTALISCLGETLGVPAYDSNATGGDVGLLQKGMSVHTEVVHARGMKQRSFLDSGRLGFRYAVAGGDDRAGVRLVSAKPACAFAQTQHVSRQSRDTHAAVMLHRMRVVLTLIPEGGLLSRVEDGNSR
jgi:hypothetical protein